MLARVEQVDARGDAAFKKAHGHLDASEQALGEVDKMVADLEAATNGGPSLDGSDAEPSGKQPESGEAREPKDSWAKG